MNDYLIRKLLNDYNDYNHMKNQLKILEILLNIQKYLEDKETMDWLRAQLIDNLHTIKAKHLKEIQYIKDGKKLQTKIPYRTIELINSKIMCFQYEYVCQCYNFISEKEIINKYTNLMLQIQLQDHYKKIITLSRIEWVEEKNAKNVIAKYRKLIDNFVDTKYRVIILEVRMQISTDPYEYFK